MTPFSVPRALALGALLLALTACGGRPSVSGETAEELLVHADAAVTALEAEDGCAAAEHVQQLRQVLEASADRIEPTALDQLRATTDVLSEQVTCEPVPTPVEDEPDPEPEPEPEAVEEDEDDDDRGKGEDKGKKKGKDRDGEKDDD